MRPIHILSHVKFSRRQHNRVAQALANVAPFYPKSDLFTDTSTCIYTLISNKVH